MSRSSRGSWFLVALAAASLFLTLPFPVPAGAAGGPPDSGFFLPLRCEIGRDCFIQNYVDHDPGPGYRDYECGSLSYDGHTGTDFRVKPGVASEQGVPILAAAAGRVTAVRDGVPDRRYRKSSEEGMKGRELGNAVVIDHGNGWKTFYGHMRKGSMKVRKGDAVAAGQELGYVGLSGKTEFPHVHFEVRHNGRVIDPFVGPDPPARCGLGEAALWTPEAVGSLAYVPTGVVEAGFAGEKPSLDKIGSISEGLALAAPRSPDMVFWVLLYGVREADVVRLRLIAPDGGVMAEERTRIPKNKAQWLGFVGKVRRMSYWAPGEYRGECELIRQTDRADESVVSLKREMRVPQVAP